MSKAVAICVLGLGHWGPNLVRAIEQNPGAKVAVAVDSSAERRNLLREKIPDLALEPSFTAALDKYEFDAVAIAIPSEHHFAAASEALKAGKHVFVEKPLTTKFGDACTLVAQAKELGRFLMTGHIFLYNRGIQRLKKIVSEGTLGKVLYVNSIRTNLGPLRNDVNVLWDLAPHDISIFNYLFDSTPIKVNCCTSSMLGRPLEDVAQGSLEYPGNRRAMFFVSWLDPQKRREVTVVGDQQMAIFDDMRPERPIKIFDRGVVQAEPLAYSDTFNSFRMSIREGGIFEPQLSTGEPLVEQMGEFVKLVQHSGSVISDGVFGSEVVRVLEALSFSAKNGGSEVLLEAIK